MTLADVGGMDEVKRRLELSFLGPLRNPELRARFGKSLRGGLLLWGPPGCGKTYLARALAGELHASFYEVGLSDVLDMWVAAASATSAPSSPPPGAQARACSSSTRSTRSAGSGRIFAGAAWPCGVW
jgi:ATPase family associated with various cellular activities (AAA)